MDPTVEPWGLNATGWVLVLLPIAMFAIGLAVGKLRTSSENVDAIADLVT